MQETRVQSLGWEDTLEQGTATRSSILAWRIHEQRSLMGYSPWGRKESDTTEWLSCTHTHWEIVKELTRANYDISLSMASQSSQSKAFRSDWRIRERLGACCLTSTGPLQWSWKKRKRTHKGSKLSMGSFLQGDKEQRRMFKPSAKDPTTGPFAISMQWLQFLLNTGHWKPIFHQSALWGRLSNEIKRRIRYTPSHVGEGNGKPLQCSCLENPMDRGAW